MRNEAGVGASAQPADLPGAYPTPEAPVYPGKRPAAEMKPATGSYSRGLTTRNLPQETQP
eukprot:2859630-Pyramimonas_sp.AAC.1